MTIKAEEVKQGKEKRQHMPRKTGRGLYSLAITLALALGAGKIQAQSLHVFPTASTASFRGLSAVSENILWISGSAGTVGRSLNGGRFFEWIKVPGYAKTEFRDIEAFSDKEAVIMGITDPAVLLRTTDAGKTWQNVFTDSTRGAFFDAIDFSGDLGILVGDPVNRKPLLAHTTDRGAHWTALPSPVLLQDTAEAFFASSGSNILLNPDGSYRCVSGGTRSFLYSSGGRRDSLPMLQGGKSTGGNAIARDPSDTGHYYIVGGDFGKDSIRAGNAVSVFTNPFRFEVPAISPSGYKSSICFVDSQRLVTCGTSGVDISTDGGKQWRSISSKSFHVCGKSRSGNKVFLAGSRGAIGVIDFP